MTFEERLWWFLWRHGVVLWTYPFIMNAGLKKSSVHNERSDNEEKKENK